MVGDCPAEQKEAGNSSRPGAPYKDVAGAAGSLVHNGERAKAAETEYVRTSGCGTSNCHTVPVCGNSNVKVPPEAMTD